MHLSKIWPLGGGGVVHTELKFIHGIAKKRGGKYKKLVRVFYPPPHFLPPNMDGFTNKAIIIKPSTFGAMGG